jgi:hypothetical protein
VNILPRKGANRSFVQIVHKIDDPWNIAPVALVRSEPLELCVCFTKRLPRSQNGIFGSNLTRGTDVYVRLFRLFCVVVSVGSGLSTLSTV